MKRIICEIEKNGREFVRVEIDEYQRRQLISLRTWYRPAEGEPKPSPKGLTVDIRHLPALRGALEEAEREARAAGLIG